MTTKPDHPMSALNESSLTSICRWLVWQGGSLLSARRWAAGEVNDERRSVRRSVAVRSVEFHQHLLSAGGTRRSHSIIAMLLPSGWVAWVTLTCTLACHLRRSLNQIFCRTCRYSDTKSRTFSSNRTLNSLQARSLRHAAPNEPFRRKIRRDTLKQTRSLRHTHSGL